MSDLNELFEDPSAKVEHFKSTYAMLKSSPDLEPPRRLVFEVEKPRPAAWLWRWLAPMAASAAVAFAVVTFTPRPQGPPQIVERVVQQQVSTPSPAPVHYQQQIDELRAELQKRDAVAGQQMSQLRNALITLDEYQKSLEKGMWYVASNKLETNKLETKGQD